MTMAMVVGLVMVMEVGLGWSWWLGWVGHGQGHGGWVGDGRDGWVGLAMTMVVGLGWP